MNAYKDMVQRIGIRFLFLEILIAVLNGDCFSQQGERLPDSIRAGENVGTVKTRDNEKASSQDSISTNSHRKVQEDVEDSVVFRAVPDSVVKQMKSDKAFAYANNPAYWKNPGTEGENDLFFKFLRWLRQNPWVVRLLYLLIGAVVLAGIYLVVVRNKLFIFYSPARNRDTVENLEGPAEDTDFSASIEAAILANDFRSAVRYLYLKSLAIAGKRKLIRLNMQSTNHDYLNQMSMHPLKDSFRFLTEVFETVWYGGFEIRQEQFQLIKEKFDQLFKNLSA